MSAQNVQVVRTLFELWGTPEVDRSFELHHEDVEIELTYTIPGLAARHHGHDGMRRFWRQWLGSWGGVEILHFDLEAAGDRVLGAWTQRMTGRGSDIEMHQEHAAIFTLRDGKVARARYFMDVPAARAEFEAG